ncbi:MAG: SAM-dependent methyltransferase [Pseudomonadota bacterium]
MTLAEYMAACLHHPEHGFYATRDPLGRAGDFITAPEISQMFGELLGLALAQAWLDQGAPEGAILAELGPGRGTLMADLWRATARVPNFHGAVRVALVEASPTLRTIQARHLAHLKPSFCAGVEDLPDGPLFVIANEFFDALPIRAFQRDGTSWRERVVGLAGDDLVLGLAPASARPDLGDVPTAIDVVETCAPGQAIAAEVGRRIARFGGAAVIVDYGAMESREATLQAVAGHRRADPFAAPGEADLSAHVAFGPLMRAAAPASAYGPVPQGVVLGRLGIAERAKSLAAQLDGAALQDHYAAFRRLTDPAEMGTLFQVTGLAPKGAPPPPGLDPR